MNCIRIKRIIDEADRPDVFPLEAAGHLAGCPDCQAFADERAKLRELTGSVARVTAPSNFNVLLNERLSRVKAQKSSWLSPAGFMRLGTATAGLAVVLIALQFGGFFSPKSQPPNDGPVVAGVPPGDGSSDVKSPEKTHVDNVSPPVFTPDRPVTIAVKSKSNNVATSRPSRDSRQDGPPLLLVRDNNGDRTMPMMPLSVGMQQVLNASYGRQQPRSSDISY